MCLHALVMTANQLFITSAFIAELVFVVGLFVHLVENCCVLIEYEKQFIQLLTT